MISNSGADLVFFVAVSNNNALAKLGSLPTNSLTGSVNPKTGFLSVTFGNGNGKRTTTGAGAVLQASNSAWGFFTNATGAGLMALNTNLASNAPVIYQMPASQNFTNQAAYQFLVRAIGASPLSYQWQFDGTNLTNGGTFSGATSPNLTVEPAGLATDAGSYSVIVTNAFGSATSTVATLTIPAPTLTITAPAARVTNPALTVQGTASDKFGLSGVQWQLNGGGWNTSTTTTNQWTNWSVQAALQAGSNIFQAYSVDLVGNHSKTKSTTVFYATESTLTLITNGFGTIKGNFTGSSLVVGQDYMVTAAPDPNNLFSNWIGMGFTATNNPLKFLMAPNMKLTANFAANPFLSAVGTYNGLFYVPGGIGAQNSGLLGGLKVEPRGAYSGRLYLGGTNYGVSGNFDLAGDASSQVTRTASLGPLSLAMHLNWDITPPLITGTVSGTNGGSWTAQLTNELAGSEAASAQYTVLIPPGPTAPTNSPGGDGYALITNYLGSATVAGALADGAAFSQNIRISTNGALAFYATPYTNGLLLGWLDVSGGAPAGSLTWIRPAAAAGVFTNGYTNVVTVQSSAWTNPGARTSALYRTNLLVSVSSGFVGGTGTLPFNVQLNTNNTFQGTSTPNSLNGSIANKTGLLNVTFVNGNNTSISGVGAVLQNTSTGGGFFTNFTGSFSLAPNP